MKTRPIALPDLPAITTRRRGRRVKPKAPAPRVVMRLSPAMEQALWRVASEQRLTVQSLLWEGVNRVLADYGVARIEPPPDGRQRKR